MSVYVGIDVHRKRSQVAVVDQAGEVLANRNVPNGVEPILGVIGDLPVGTPAAFEAAFGWGWLVELLEDYGFKPHLVHPSRCKAIASARLKNDKVDGCARIVLTDDCVVDGCSEAGTERSCRPAATGTGRPPPRGAGPNGQVDARARPGRSASRHSQAHGW
ncbi:MAG TPA: transposase [Jiangellaceae bacterium]|nr:transposase [Jiangellaceae bacterium]